MKLKLHSLPIILYFFLLNNSNAQQGKLDTTFNSYDNGTNGDGFDNAIRTTSIQTDGNLIVGGDFLNFNGKPLSYLTRLKTDGSVDTDFDTGSGFNGKIYSSYIQSDGKIIIGGNFTSYNGENAGRLIRLNSDGSHDTTFNTSLGASSGIINQIVSQSDGKIIIVGSFTKYNGITVNRIARILPDGNLDFEFLTGSGAPSNINCVEIQSDGKIILAGNFIKFNGVDVNRITRLNPDGSTDITFNVGSGFDNDIHAMSLQPNGRIILGGEFTGYNGNTANRIIRLHPDGTPDTTFLSGTGLNNGIVYVIKTDTSGNIMLGGSFTDLYNGSDVNRLMLLNPDGTIKPDFDIGNGPGSASVYSLANSFEGAWYIGGSFSVFDSQNQGKLAKIDANGIHDISYLSAGVGFDNSVLKVLPLSDNSTMVFGNFSRFNGVPSSRIARILPDGNLDITFNSAQTNANNSIKTAAQQPDGKMIIGGNFTSYNNTTCNRIARILSDGSLDNTFVSGIGFNGQVVSVAIQSDQKILVAGNFTKYNGITSGRVIRLMQDGTIDGSFNTVVGANGAIDAILVQPDGKIILGGRFDMFNGTGYSRLVRLNTDGGVDSSFSVGAGFDKNVYALNLQSDGKIIVGGSFLNYNGVSKRRILRLNSNGTLDTTFDSGTGFSNGDVRSILIQSDDRILTGGAFSGNYNGIASLRLLRLSSNGIYDSSFSVSLNSTLYTMEITADNKLIIGGNFNSVSGVAKHRVARLKLCTDSSRWNGSWSNGSASAGKELVFEEDYLFSASVNACSCSINSAKTVTISSGKTLGLSFNYSGNGILVLENTASLYQSDDEMVNTGIIHLKRKTAPIRKFDYTCWSSPVENHRLVDVSPDTLSDKFFSFDAILRKWAGEVPSNIMTVGKGYIIRGPQNFSSTVPEKYEAIFKGIPVNGKIATPLGTPGNSNLIGNPYPSAISADSFLIDNAENIEGSLYFWTHNTALTNTKYNTNDYAVYNLLGGVGTRRSISSGQNETEPDGKIASGQSFFVTGLVEGEKVKFDDSMRIIEQNYSFFKPAKTTEKKKIVEKNRIWLNLTNEENVFKQLLVGYIDGATNSYDLFFDGESLDENRYINFYSYNEGKNWVIQGRQFPFHSDEVTLGYKTEINGNFTISIDHLDESFIGQSVYLEDKEKRILHNLNNGSYSFSTEKGIFNSRFVLKFSDNTLQTKEFLINKKGLVIYHKKGQLVIESEGSNIQKIEAFDISGKLILEQNANQNTIIISNLKPKNQILIFKIKTEDKLETKKIIY